MKRAARTRSSRDRFAARARAARLRAWRPALITLAVTGAVVGLSWIVLSSRLLAVHDVAVAGAKRVSPADVRRALSEVDGQALARVDLAVLRHRVEALPGVRRAVVSRDWPSTIRVQVEERVAVAAVHRSDGWWLVDAEGVEYGPASAREPGGVHELRLPPTGRSTAAARSAARIIVSLPPGLLAKVARVDARSADDVRLRLTSDAVVVWGSEDRSAEKARILSTLINKRAHVYDVSSPSVVTTR